MSILDDDDKVWDDREPAPRRAAARKRNRWVLFTVLGLLAAVLLGAIGVIGWYGKSINDALNSMRRDDSLMPVENEYTPPKGKALEPGEERDGIQAPVNILILGSDSRGTDRGRSDVFMLAHISGDRKSVHLISIPRDYWVEVPGRGTAKINAAYSWGGAPLAVQTVQQLLGVRIDHVAITDFDGYIRTIDALGGVQVYNGQASGIDGYTFPKGELNLDSGEKALVYVRERYGLSGGDFDRSERQRDVVMAVFDKLTSRGTLTDPVKFRDAVTAVGPSFTVDSGLTNDRIVGLAMSLGFDGSRNIHSHLAPTGGFGRSSDGQSYVKVDHPGLDRLGQKLRDDDMATYS